MVSTTRAAVLSRSSPTAARWPSRPARLEVVPGERAAPSPAGACWKIREQARRFVVVRGDGVGVDLRRGADRDERAAFRSRRLFEFRDASPPLPRRPCGARRASRAGLEREERLAVGEGPPAPLRLDPRVDHPACACRLEGDLLARDQVVEPVDGGLEADLRHDGGALSSAAIAIDTTRMIDFLAPAPGDLRIAPAVALGSARSMSIICPRSGMMNATPRIAPGDRGDRQQPEGGVRVARLGDERHAEQEEHRDSEDHARAGAVDRRGDRLADVHLGDGAPAHAAQHAEASTAAMAEPTIVKPI